MINKFKHWWMTLLKGIVLILLAFFVFNHPVGMLIGIVMYFSIALLITGILTIIGSVLSSKTDDDWGWKLTGGVIDLLFALILLSNPGITAAILPFILGFWIIVYGVIIFGGSFKAKKEGDDNWWISLLGGVLTIMFGYFIMSDLFAGAVAITIWIGLGLLIFGIINVVVSLKMRKVKIKIEDAIS